MKKVLFCFLALAVLVGCQKAESQNVIEQSLNQGWTLTGDTLSIKMQVDVPSVVQQSLYENGVIPHPYLGTVENQLLWISDHVWDYALRFDVDEGLFEKEVVELVFEGLDTYADISLNGYELISTDNQFREWKIDVKHYLKEKDNLLEVHFTGYDSVMTDLSDQVLPVLPEKYAVSRKAPYQHGWDWAPKYKNVGIWKPVKLMGWNEVRLEDAYAVTGIADSVHAMLTLHLDVENATDGEYEVIVSTGSTTLANRSLSLSKGRHHKVFPVFIQDPQLWWPNEMGEQPLYDFEVVLKKGNTVLDSKKFKTGIRTFEMVDEPDSIGRAFYFKVNGVPMYAKGANYVPEEMIETWINADNTLKLLRMAKDAHFNMLRVWGGGIYPSDDFFNICDSLGILVWQDFMYAGSMYPFDETFLENARIEAEEQVRRLASHPSLALWCGGNEISEGYYNWGWQQSLGWSEEDDKAVKAGYDRLFEGILPWSVEIYDGSRPYWPSSPSKGWGRPESLTEGDVHYWGVWWGEQPYEMYREKVGRFNSEYGYQSYPDYSTLQKIAQGKALSKDAKVIAAHQKHQRGTRQIDDFIKRYFPNVKPKDFEEYVHLSQLSQAYGMEIAIEAHRTAKPYNMGTLYWQLNDAWPVTSWSSIDYYGNPKVFYERLKTLYAPVLLSLDKKDYGVFVTSDLMRSIDGTLTVTVCDLEDLKLDRLKDNPKFEQKVKVEIDANENRKYTVEGLGDYLRNADLQKVYVKLQLTEGDTLTAERKCYFSAFFE